MKRRLAARWGPLWVAAALTLLAAVPGRAAPWPTEGGSPERQNVVTEPVGWLAADREQWLELALGQSASQPLLLDDRVFHVAGLGLYRLRLERESGQPADLSSPDTLRLVEKSNRHPWRPDYKKVSSSTPTRSPNPDSPWLYWGTPHGQVWALNIQTGDRNKIDLDIGCEVVSSPLVFSLPDVRLGADARRDVVIVGQKPVDGECGVSGKVFAIWGLDGTAEPQKTAFVMGGWVTSSPVPADEPGTFIVGADAVKGYEPYPCGTSRNGRVLRMRVLPDGGTGYRLQPYPWPGTAECFAKGVTGTFTTANGYVYWVDVDAVLRARHLNTGEPPPGWGGRTAIPLAPLVEDRPGATAFTNTTPAIDTEGGTMYITLRNYWPTADTEALRGCVKYWEHCPYTGAPGAILALDLQTGARKWAERMPLNGYSKANREVRAASLNKSPLVVRSQGAVVFVDVNGIMYSRKLDRDDAGQAAGLMVSPGRVLADWDILNGKTPERGEYTWSQVSGAGTEPSAGSGTLGENRGKSWLMVGANWRPDGVARASAWQYGSLVMIPFGPTYNLRWADSGWAAPPLPWRDGHEVKAGGTVVLEHTPLTLGDWRRTSPVTVSWFMVAADEDGAGGKVLRSVLACRPDDRALDPGLTGGSSSSAELTRPILIEPSDPAAGYLLGVIDAAGLARDETSAEGRLARQLLAACGADPDASAPDASAAAVTAAEMARLPGGGNGLADNFLWIPYEKQGPLDLVAALTAPAAVSCTPGATFSPTWTITNRSDGVARNVRAVVQVWSDGAPAPRVLWEAEIPEMKPGQILTYSHPISVRCDESYTVRVTVAFADPAVVDVDPGNNRADSRTVVGPYVPPRFELDGGPGKVIVVDPRCKVGQAESARPCENLDVRHPDLAPGSGYSQ